MTVKQFFKSNAFKSLIVLIAIVLVAGALLAIFNDVLYITDEERLNRTLSEIYGKEVSAKEVELSDEEKTYSYGSVDSVYFIEDDGNYLFRTTGTGGYPGNGTVTLWTVVTCTGTREQNNLVLTGIEKVVYDSNEGQTQIANLNDSFYAFFANHDDLVAAGGYFTAVKGGTDDLNNVVLQSTMSSKAASNAVNTALACFRKVMVGEEEPAPGDPVEEFYGETVSYDVITVADAGKTNEYGTVDAVYYIPEKSQYLFLTTGTGGFSDGTVTLWTAINAGESENNTLTLTGIEKVVYESNVDQSWIDNVATNADFFNNFANKDDLVAAGGYFTANPNGSGELNNVVAGTSMASNAACNAVNTALYYFRITLAGEEAPTPSDPVEEFYGEKVDYDIITVADADKTNEYGTIEAVYFVADKGQYLFKTTGIGGFKNGTVTLWTALNVDIGSFGGRTLTGIEKVVLDSYDATQTFIGRLDDTFWNAFANNDSMVAEGSYFYAPFQKEDSVTHPENDLSNVVTGASWSSQASCNAVNAALNYFRTMLAFEEDPASDFYGYEVGSQEVPLTEEEKLNEYGTVNGVFYIDDGNYLIMTTGAGGYADGTGTVTLWTLLACEGSRLSGNLELAGIEKVVLYSNVGQTKIKQFTQDYFDKFATKDNLVVQGGYFTALKDSTDDLNNVIIRSTMTSDACCNAVNAALYYFRNVLLGESVTDSDGDPASEICGQTVTSHRIYLSDGEALTDYGTVDEVYYIEDNGYYLFKTTGTGGFRGGTVTVWTLVTCTGSVGEGNLQITGIEKVVYESNVSQSWMDKIPQSFFDDFANKDDLVADGGYFTADPESTNDLNNVVVGVSKASTASCNAVNAALFCLRSTFLGQSNINAEKEQPSDTLFDHDVTLKRVPLSATEKDGLSDYGTIDALYYVVEDGTYLFKTTGIGGFKNGTVTLWTLVNCTGSLEDGTLQLTGIDKVVYISNVSQSWMDKIPQSFFDNFSAKDDLVAEGGYFFADKDSTDDLNNVTVGVSKASTASCNAVNAALWYFRNVFMGGDA